MYNKCVKLQKIKDEIWCYGFKLLFLHIANFTSYKKLAYIP